MCGRPGSGQRRDPGRADGAQPDDGGDHRADAAARDRRDAVVAAPGHQPRHLALPEHAVPAAAGRDLDREQGARRGVAGAASHPHRERANDRRVVGVERDAQRVERGPPQAGLGRLRHVADARRRRLHDQGRRARRHGSRSGRRGLGRSGGPQARARSGARPRRAGRAPQARRARGAARSWTRHPGSSSPTRRAPTSRSTWSSLRPLRRRCSPRTRRRLAAWAWPIRSTR